MFVISCRGQRCAEPPSGRNYFSYFTLISSENSGFESEHPAASKRRSKLQPNLALSAKARCVIQERTHGHVQSFHQSCDRWVINRERGRVSASRKDLIVRPGLSLSCADLLEVREAGLMQMCQQRAVDCSESFIDSAKCIRLNTPLNLRYRGWASCLLCAPVLVSYDV